MARRELVVAEVAFEFDAQTIRQCPTNAADGGHTRSVTAATALAAVPVALIRCSFCNQLNPTPAPIYRPVSGGAGSKDGNGIWAAATPEIEDAMVAARRVRFRVIGEFPILLFEIIIM